MLKIKVKLKILLPVILNHSSCIQTSNLIFTIHICFSFKLAPKSDISVKKLLSGVIEYLIIFYCSCPVI